jgi:hypothetical protein
MLKTSDFAGLVQLPEVSELPDLYETIVVAKDLGCDRAVEVLRNIAMRKRAQEMGL